MFKFVCAFTALCCLPAHASVVLLTQAFGEECVISESQVTKSVSLHGGELSFVTKKKITTNGVEAYALAALGQAKPERANSLGVSSHVEVDGVRAALQFEDSVEARMLLSFIMKACNG